MTWLDIFSGIGVAATACVAWRFLTLLRIFMRLCGKEPDEL